MNDFDYIDNAKLRAFNRCQTLFVIAEELGDDGVLHYVSKFSEEDKKEIYRILSDIEARGIKAVREEVRKEMQ